VFLSGTLFDLSLTVATQDSDRSFADSELHLTLIKMQKFSLGTQPTPCCASNSHSIDGQLLFQPAVLLFVGLH
jgi:hypothetical protein